jgi:P2 family phage contractile tail tube protein
MSFKFPKTLKNFSLEVDGKNQAGRVLELTPPALAFQIMTVKAGRLIPVPVVAGVSAVMKATFTMAEYSKELQNKVGKPDVQTFKASGSLNDDKSTTTTKATITMKGFLSYTPSVWKAGQMTQDKYEVQLEYFRFDGQGSIELDGKNHKYTVDGEDIVETIRGKIKV